MPNTNRHRPRAPRGIRRHYSDEEALCVALLPAADSARTLHRPELGTELKQRRINGTLVDTHHKDGSWKYAAQEISKETADRNGADWQDWENTYLLTACDSEDLLTKAQHLRRTYRACESQRRDLLKLRDKDQ